MNDSLVEIKGLTKHFPIKKGILEKNRAVKAVEEVSLTIRRGETLGLVGESGCGKSTLGRCLLKLIDPTSGQIIFDGFDISALKTGAMKPFRRRMQIIFQDPYSSLNPRMTVGSLLEEPLIIHRLSANAKAREARVAQLLQLVGLSPEAQYRYPHEFSGGQRQRIGIARALAVEPDFIVCDEPVSALDVSIQAQIINLLIDLQEKLKLTYLFISHDLRVVEHISHRVAVMYLGKIVEIADKKAIYSNPQHPYTQALLSSVPRVEVKDRTERIALLGEPPKPTAPPPGCAFHPRCRLAEKECQTIIPELRPLLGSEHRVSCLVVERLSQGGL